MTTYAFVPGWTTAQPLAPRPITPLPIQRISGMSIPFQLGTGGGGSTRPTYGQLWPRGNP